MKTFKRLLTILSLVLLTSCGVNWHVSTLNYDPIYDDENYIVVSDDVVVDTLNEFQFRNRLRTDFQFRYDFAQYALTQPRSFDWKFPDAHPYEAKVGFVAQELETVDSDWVITEDFIEDTIKTANFDDEKALLTDGKKKTTKLGKKDAMYISVIQQLITRIEALEDA